MMNRHKLLAELECLVPDDGTGTLRVIVDHAQPGDTAQDLAEIVCEAIADAQLERELSALEYRPGGDA